jgi:carbonic anhydrase
MKTVEITYRYGSTDVPPRPRPADAAAARLRLDEGSRGFMSLLEGLSEGDGLSRRIVAVDPRDLGLQGAEGAAAMQRPYAAVLGCSDARVPIELIFNEGPNDLFVVRVAGNSLGADVLGSLRYAVEHLRDSLRLIVVLGHSGCGALSTAVDAFLHPAAYLPVATNYALRGILDRLLIVVQAVARILASVHGADVSQRPGYRVALIEAAIAANAAFTAHTVQQELHGINRSDLRAVYGVYLLQAHEI